MACQAPLSMEFSRQEYWSGFPFPTLVYTHTHTYMHTHAHIYILIMSQNQLNNLELVVKLAGECFWWYGITGVTVVRNCAKMMPQSLWKVFFSCCSCYPDHCLCHHHIMVTGLKSTFDLVHYYWWTSHMLVFQNRFWQYYNNAINCYFGLL